MLFMLEVGRHLGIRRHAKDPDEEKSSLGSVETAVFALFGLMIAFTFSGAASRFNEKRMLIADEANCIETAYLRLQLVPEEPRRELQDLFRAYADSRIAYYRKLPDLKAAGLEMARYKELQDEIWIKAVSATGLPEAHKSSSRLLLAEINAMIDITTTRGMMLQIHPPLIIYVLLFGLALLCSLLAGYRMASIRRRSWLHILAFVFITSAITYVVLDVEYPRAGLIRLETADQVLVDARQAMR